MKFLLGILAALLLSPAAVAGNYPDPILQNATGNTFILVANNTALKNLLAGGYSTVYRAGFAAAGDGGGNVYVWSGTACSISGGDNGSQVAPASGTGCWIGALGSDIDVRIFGAVGDGSTSDSAAVTAAATAAFNGGGRKLRFPGTGHAYVFGAGVTLPSLVSVEGDGMATWPGSDGSVAQWTASGSWIECEDTTNPCVTISGVGNLVRDINFINPQATPPSTIASATVTAGGSAYTSAPTVAFSAPTLSGGVTATGTAVLTSGVVTSVTITNAGPGYISKPTIAFSGGGGSGAAATAVLTAWTPTIFPYVLAVNGSGNFTGLENVSFTASTHCIDFEGPTSGVAGIWAHLDHIWFNGCFVRGTKFHLIDNTVSMHDLRYDNWWYANYSQVVSYMEANKVDWDLQYLANAQATNIEFLQSWRAIQLTDATVSSGFGNVTFAANDLQLSNISFNEVCQAIVPAASTTHGSGAMSNVIAYGDSGTNCYGAPVYMFDFSSGSANWDISNLDAGYVQSLMNVGASSTIKLSNADVQAYSEVTAGGVAFNIAAGGELLLSGTPSNAIRPASGAGPLYAGMPTPEWQPAVLTGSTFGAVLADGELGLRRNVLSDTAPGGAFVKLGAVCGTNAGTARIVGYAGTDGVPFTILDNIGAGVTGC